MGWSIGYDSRHKRDIGYGVPAVCDHPKCEKEINRGLSYVCGSEPYGGDFGCGLFFCGDHLRYKKPRYAPRDVSLCPRCIKYRKHYPPKPDIRGWVWWKLEDESWAEWRKENPHEVEMLKKSLKN